MATTETLDPENHVDGTEHSEENQTNEGPEAQDFPPLFEDESEALSEEQLTGDEELPESEEAATSPPEGEETPKEAKEEAKQEPEKDVEAEQDDKPPQGYVPLAALHEERGKRQYQAQEIETLRQEIQTLKQTPDSKAESTEFSVLSDKEFQELLDDDPTEAILYGRRLIVHESQQAKNAEAGRRDQSIIDQSTQAMREAVPQIYDSESTINQDLTKFAVEQGFNEQYLPVMTDPRTKIIAPGSTEPVLLGDVAVGQVKMLYNLYQRGNNDDRAAIEKEVTERVTKEVTDTVTKQIMAKFKATPAQEYHSLGEIPGGGDEPFDVAKNLTTAQIDKLSDSQRRAYLGG